MGGIRLRRSIKLAPGVRLNVGKTGLGLSAGVRGARYSVHSSGRRTKTVGIPGTGISHVSSSGGGRGGGRSDSSARRSIDQQPGYASGAQAAALLPKAGIFASTAEKRYRDGLVAYLKGERVAAAGAFEAATVADPNAISAHMLAAICLDAEKELPRVVHHLEAVVTSTEAYPDKYLAKFLPAGSSQLSLGVRITELIEARVPFDRAGATLLLAEAYQESGRLDEAIGLVQQLHDANPGDSAIRLSLADLLLADGDLEGVVEAAGNIGNVDDLTVSLIHMRAAALTALGHHTAAFDAFKDALAKTSNRDGHLLSTIRYDRALAFEKVGQKARARADYERLYASDPNYRDVRARLAALS